MPWRWRGDEAELMCREKAGELLEEEGELRIPYETSHT